MTSIDSINNLDDHIRPVEYVLFDFDGPICNLFSGRPAKHVAGRMVDALTERGFPEEKLRLPGSPVDVLRDASESWRGQHPQWIKDLAEQLTEEEIEAARQARPESGLAGLLAELAAARCRMAITTNNSAESVRAHLKGKSISGYFGGFIFGRGEPESMKPDPDCLKRAMRELRVHGDTSRVLMVGDSPADVAAARQAGVRFLGYSGQSVAKGRDLREAGGVHAVESLNDLRAAFERRRTSFSHHPRP